MIDLRTIETKRLFAEIRQFLGRSPIPRSQSIRSDLLKLDGFDEAHLGPEYRQKLARAIRGCDAYLTRLKTHRATIVGYGDLVKDLLERKNGLIREIEQFEIFTLKPGEKEAFSSDVRSLQDAIDNRGFGMDQPLPSPKPTPRKMQQDLSGANEKIVQCKQCSAFVRIHDVPPDVVGRPGPKLLIAQVYCPICGHVIGRGSTTQRVRI